MTHVFLGRPLPVEQSHSIWVFCSERDELDIRLGKILLFQAVDSSLAVFLKSKVWTSPIAYFLDGFIPAAVEVGERGTNRCRLRHANASKPQPLQL